MIVHGEDRRPLSIPALLRYWSEATPDAPALLAPGRQPLSYRHLHEQTAMVAAQLHSIGIAPDDRVAIVHRNGPELAAAFLAVSSAAVCAPLNPTYRLSEFDFYLSDLRAEVMIVAPEADSQLRQLAERRRMRVLEVQPLGSSEAGAISLSDGRARKRTDSQLDDAALVLHTSGTTSRPKVVPITHRRLCLSARNIAGTLELERGDRCLNVMPLFHIHGLVGALLSSLHAGASVVCTPGFHAPSFHGWLSELEPSWYTAVPTMHQAVLARAPSGVETAGRSTLRFIRSSSAPLPPHVYDALEETFGVPVIEAYGMTEAAHQMASNPLPPGVRKRGAVGLPTGIELAVLGSDDHALPPGEVGEVVIRGGTVFAGYESNPEANAEAFIDGWFRTGDEGSFDEDGYLCLRGRIKEIINRAGEKVSPAEVEDALLGHPDVMEAASFSVPDARLGEDVGAAVVLRAESQATERDLQEHAARQLADFKVPSVVRIVDEIPTGPTGKLQRIGLAERLGVTEVERPVQGPYVAPHSPFEKEMAELWASTLGVERAGRDDDFFSLGGDSILAAELMARIAERHGRTLPLTTLMWAPTLSEFTELLEEGTWDDDSRIVPIQTGGSRPPLFVTHGLGDEVLNVAVLKRTLGEEQPLYAVRAVRDRFAYRSVEEMAREYFDEIRLVQPSGPYRFASMCSGSALVIELVRHASASGEDIALAAVIDPLSDFGHGAVRHYTQRVIEHARHGRFRWAIRRKLRHWLAHLAPRRFPDPELAVDPLAPAMNSVRRHYRIRPMPGTLTVISTMDYQTPRSFWEKLADRVEWYDVQVPHQTIFQLPHADVLGVALAHVLRDVGSDGGAP